MVKIKLNRVIELPVSKAHLEIGEHKISEDDFYHFYVQGLIAEGNVTVIDDVAPKPLIEEPLVPVVRKYSTRLKIVEILPVPKVLRLTEAEKTNRLKKRKV